MGLTPFACITEQDHSVRVVYPDGHIENRTRSCSVYELLRGNPDYFVCGSTPYTITNRMASHEQLEKGFTYFVGASPNAQPFLESQPSKRTHRSASRMLPRFSRHGVQGREMRSPTQQSRRVFDVHSAKMQLEGMKSATSGGVAHHHLVLDRPPRHLKLVFFRHCLQALRLPRQYADLTDTPPSLISSNDNHSSPSPSSSMKDVELVNSLLKSAARSELGVYVSRRQEFYLRRQRRRRKTLWKPVLQSISETSPVVDFRIPDPESAVMSKRFSPPQPAPPRPMKNISPPRQPAPSKYISPPRQQPCGPAQKYISPPRQTPRRRKPTTQRSLYMA